MTDKIIRAIETNKISSVEVADALGKTGVIPNVKPLCKGKYVVGKVFYVPTWGESNWALHERIQKAPRDSVVYVDAIDCNQRAVLGDLVAKQLFVYKRISGLIVNGLVRDAHRLLKEDYPIWCSGVTPLGCSNKKVNLDIDTEKMIKRRTDLYRNSIIIADDSGCTLINSGDFNERLVHALEQIELQEDIWYFCLDTLKMSTYEIICLKKYLNNPDLLPEALSDRLKNTIEDNHA